MKDYIQLLKRQELLQNAELSIWNKQSSGHFMLITKLSCSDKAVKPRVCSSSAFPGAGEGREAGKALGPSVGRAGAGGGWDREEHLHSFSTPSSPTEFSSCSHAWHKPRKPSLTWLATRLLEVCFFLFPQVLTLIYMVKNCKCPISPILQEFFFPILLFTISINQCIFHWKVKLLNKKLILPENIICQLMSEIQLIRTVHEDEPKTLYPLQPNIFSSIYKFSQAIFRSNKWTKKTPFQTKCHVLKLWVN